MYLIKSGSSPSTSVAAGAVFSFFLSIIPPPSPVQMLNTESQKTILSFQGGHYTAILAVQL